MNNIPYAVKCPYLGIIARFALKGDADEWKDFYFVKYPSMIGLEVVYEPILTE